MKKKATQPKIYYDEERPIKKEILQTAFHQYQNNNRKRKKRRHLKLWVLIVIFLIFLTIIVINTFKIFNWNKDNQKTTDNINKVENITDMKELKDNSNTEYINEPTDKESDYWYYIKFPMIEVNFKDLINKNRDTIGWINVNNTNINYPIVQTKDNDYYLTHSYDKTPNEAGWVFMDYRNNQDLNNKNTIIYAHSRLDKTMFGSLSQVLKTNWYQNKDNHIIKISTPTENSLWQIFSVYKIKEETYYLTTEFNNNDTYLEFLNTLKIRSKYNFDVQLSNTDTILTLSTCYSDTERTVVHAKKIKKATRNS